MAGLGISYYEGSLLFLLLVFAWEMYIQARQHWKYYETKIPAPLKGIVSQEVFDKARSYGKDKSTFTFAHQSFSLVETMIVLLYGGIPYLWGIAGRTMERFGLTHSEHEVMHSVIFLYMATLYQVAVQLPWNMYYTFVLEQKHGFNKQTLRFYVADQTKSLLLTVFLTTLLVPPLVYIVKLGGDHFYVYAWLFVFVISLLAVTIYQDYIAPMFDKYEPLKECELKTKIERLASSIRFPLGQLLVVHASMRSSHSNAYFYGFFNNKKIVLFDTLLPPHYNGSGKDEADRAKVTAEIAVKDAVAEKRHEPCTDEEILAVLSHELGHWKLNHPLKNFVIGQVNVFLSFLLFGLLMHNDDVYISFGFNSKPVIIGLLLILQYIFAPVNLCLNYLMTRLTRRAEHQADAYAVKLGYGQQLQTALVKLQIGNLGNMNPDTWYSEYHYSHPPLVERLQTTRGLVDAAKTD